MKTISGIHTHLYPVELYDAKFIAQLRSNPMNNKYLSSNVEITENEQLEWIIKNKTTRDFYFIIKDFEGKSLGTISLYNIINDESAEFGRYICTNSICSVESEYLLLFFAFKTLKLDYIYCRTVKENIKVWKQHKKFGFSISNFEEDNLINKSMVIQKLTKKIFEAYDYSWVNRLLTKLRN